MQTETQQLAPNLQQSQTLPQRKPAGRQANGLRSLTESMIVLAVVVMLVRVFTVEGFIIQTGSMAPTLRGFHQHIVCPKCKFVFAFGTDKETAESNEAKKLAPKLVDCPHCGQHEIVTTNVPVTQGDQLLVHKFAYDFWYHPRRLDVVLFRNPQKPREVYVKRILGLPGENVHVFKGDFFVNGERFRKSLKQQYALRIPVFDTRYKPIRNRWLPEKPTSSAWQPHENGFLAHSPSDRNTPSDRNEIDWLVYEHRMANGKIEQIHDDYGYNRPRPEKQRRTIHDLMLALPVKCHQPRGKLLIQMRNGRKVFELQIDFQQRAYQLREVNSNQVLEQSRIPERWDLSSEHLLEMSLFDQQLLIALDRKPITQPIALENDLPDVFEKSIQADWQIRVGISDAECAIPHLQLFRDIYYTQRVSGLLSQDPSLPVTYQLSAHGYFVLGDNSPISADSREWTNPEVAEHLILGKPIFVHLPSQPRLLRIGGWTMRIRIPDVSRIRYIH